MENQSKIERVVVVVVLVMLKLQLSMVETFHTAITMYGIECIRRKCKFWKTLAINFSYTQTLQLELETINFTIFDS